MSEVWVAAVVGAVGSYASSRSQKKALKDQREHDAAMTEEESWRSMQREQHSAALSDFYNRRDRAEAQRGLDEFRKFSTVQDFAPGYVNDNPRIEQPVLPDLNDYGTDPNAVVENQGGGSKGQSFLERRLDPLKIF